MIISNILTETLKQLKNKYPLQLEKEFFRTMRDDYRAEMKEVLQELIVNLKRDPLLQQRDVKQDSFMNLMGYLGKKIFNYEFAYSEKQDTLLGNLVGNFKLLDNWVSSKFNESINERSKKLTVIRPKEPAFVNGQMKMIYKPLEKFTVTENGIEKVKYQVNELGITLNKPGVVKVADEKTLKERALENAMKVKDIKKEQALKLQDIIRDAYYSGKTTDEIVDKVGAVIDAGEGRLRNIARSQVTKFANDVQNAKMEKAGVDRWTWATMGDERVRKTHRDLEDSGDTFDNITGAQGRLEESGWKFPGDPYNCRCWKDPVF